MVSRVENGRIARWWWEVDRWFLASFLVLMGLGIMLSFAASPAVAERIGLDSFHFVIRQIIFMVPALVCMILVSLMTPRGIRRLALGMFIVSVLLIIFALNFGVEVKGSRRWVHLGSLSVQPSEYLKPAFVILCAWLFSERARQPQIPGNLLSMGLLGLAVLLLVSQPDLGQTMLVAATWGVMFFMAGMPWLWIIVLGGLASFGGLTAYSAFPHVAERIDRFLTGEGDTFQVDMGHEAMVRGGWFGQGPGEGAVKRILPDSHTDFVFAVAGEEFGLILCIIIMAIFAFVVLRGLSYAMRESDDFSRYAVGGLVSLFGFQSIINMGVNLQLMPAKGMTLPFISYGGSSLIAIAISMGMVLALTRMGPERRRVFDHSARRRNAAAVG